MLLLFISLGQNWLENQQSLNNHHCDIDSPPSTQECCRSCKHPDSWAPPFLVESSVYLTLPSAWSQFFSAGHHLSLWLSALLWRGSILHGQQLTGTKSNINPKLPAPLQLFCHHLDPQPSFFPNYIVRCQFYTLPSNISKVLKDDFLFSRSEYCSK